MNKIDPRSPGKSTATDDFCSPHGHEGIGNSSMGGHVGVNRDDNGNFSNKGFSRGGSSPDGDEYVSKYRPRGGGDQDNGVPEGSELNDEGTGYA